MKKNMGDGTAEKMRWLFKGKYTSIGTMSLQRDKKFIKTVSLLMEKK